MKLKELLINSADSITLTVMSLLFGIEATVSPENFKIFIALCAISFIAFFTQFYMELKIGLLSGLIRCIGGGSK